jgi:hypothetical protein
MSTLGTILEFMREGTNMGTIVEVMPEGAAFNPEDMRAMSMALEDVCKALSVDRHRDRKVIAIRIVELACRGERSPTKLRDRLLAEANSATGS